MDDKIRYCVVSHTHWDREWYLPFEQMRIRLVDMMDNLLTLLKMDEGFRFHMDAQTIVLEDYLEIRPQNREIIEKFVKEERILIGPWYVQNDFHLTSAEATVRNLLIGTEIANAFGKCMDIGYAADQFGLCSQLPQILSGFDLDTCVFGRGFGREGSQFYWQSEEGSKVLCEHMFTWYNNLQRLPEDEKAALWLVRERGGRCLNAGKGRSCLLMNGVDHLEAQENLTEIIGKVRPLLNENEELFQDTLPEYMNRLKTEIKEKGLSLPTYTGEMRDGGQYNVLTGTLSSRVYLKTMNARIQSALEKRFEPEYSMLSMFGAGEYPAGYSKYLWKLLIHNHPHDSICGCSVDSVHKRMVDRFDRIEENLAVLNERFGDAFVSHIDRAGISGDSYLITCVNTSAYAYDGVLKVSVDIISSEDKGAFEITTPAGKKIPFTVEKVEKEIGKRVLSPINLPGEKIINRYTLLIKPGKLAGLSHTTFVLTPKCGNTGKTPDAPKSARVMENEFLKVNISSDGTVSVKNKKTGKVYPQALYLIDESDKGQSYNYSVCPKEERITSKGTKAKVAFVRDTALLKERRIDYVLKADRDCGKGNIYVSLFLSLSSGSDRLEIKAKVTNEVTYHRLRLVFGTEIVSDKNYAGQPFDLIERNKTSNFDNDTSHPATDFFGVEGDGEGFAVFTEGLYDYEQMTGEDDGKFALTLLRSTGSVTGEYGTRVTEGWEAPECQCIGTYEMRLAVYPYAKDRTAAGVAYKAAQFMTPAFAAVGHCDPNKFVGGRPFVQAAGVPDLFYRPLENADKIIPQSKTYFKLTQNVENAMQLSAFKRSEDGEGYILRFYNSTSKTVDFDLMPGVAVKKISLCGLNEKERSALCPVKRKVSVNAKPKEIITIKFTL